MSRRRQRRRAAARRAAATIGLAILAAAVVIFAGWWFLREPAPIDVVRDGSPSWSPDSQLVLFYSERGGKADLFSAERSGGARRQLTDTPFDEGAPAMSPDGQWIAYDTDRDGNFEIYVMRADGTGAQRLTTNPARDLAPAWSPDGQQIVFMSTRVNPDFDVYRMNADGSRVESLTHGSSNWFPQYSPDGARLALHIMRDVHVLDLASSQLRKLTQDPLNGMHPTWSPDGEHIAFMSWRNGKTEIFTATADGSEQQLLVSMPSGDAVDPRWSPDGKSIAFVHVPAGGVQGSQTGSEERIVYVYEIATKILTRISRR